MKCRQACLNAIVASIKTDSNSITGGRDSGFWPLSTLASNYGASARYGTLFIRGQHTTKEIYSKKICTELPIISLSLCLFPLLISFHFECVFSIKFLKSISLFPIFIAVLQQTTAASMWKFVMGCRSCDDSSLAAAVDEDMC